MATEHPAFEQVRALFDELADLDPQQRESALARASVDEAVRDEVRVLLAHLDEGPEPEADGLGAIADAALGRIAKAIPEQSPPPGSSPEDFPMTLDTTAAPTIRITHLDRSSRAGQTQEFTADRVRLGRRPDNEVAFDPNADQMVSGHHAKLTITRGAKGPAIELTDLGSRNGTTVNGTPVEGSVALGPTDRVVLGDNGPELTVELIVGGIPATIVAPRAAQPAIQTEPQAKSKPKAKPARERPVPPPNPFKADAPKASSGEHPKQGIGLTTLNQILSTSTKRERRKMFAAVGAVLVVAIGAVAWLALRPKPEPGPASAVPQTIIAQVERSVYLVLLEDASGEAVTLSSFGTAWSVRPGLLATNAHVAKGLDELEPGQRLIARSSDESRHDLLVTGSRIHPGYDRFAQLSFEYLALDPETGKRVELITPFDVALLEVSPIDGAEQAPPLELLPEGELGDLASGQPIALIGYPAENLIGTNPAAPVPTVQLNNLNKLSTIFKARGDADTNRMLSYDIDSAGGASGSPIIDTRGRVIGLLSAGDVAHLNNAQGWRERMSKGITHGQRVDMLAELLDGDAQRLTDDRDDAWERAFVRQYLAGVREHTRYADMLVRLFTDEPLTRVLDETRDLSAGNTQRVFTYRFPSAGTYEVVAFARGSAPPLVLQVANLNASDRPVSPPVVDQKSPEPWKRTQLTITGTPRVQLRVALDEPIDADIEVVLMIYRVNP